MSWALCTGVPTCALPIYTGTHLELEPAADAKALNCSDQRFFQRDERSADTREPARKRHARLALRPVGYVAADAKAFLAFGRKNRAPELGIVVDRPPRFEYKIVHRGMSEGRREGSGGGSTWQTRGSQDPQ